jgi:coenzyme F420-reducing hydrogenase alpha subunit
VLQLEPAIELLLQFNVPSADGVNQKRSWNTQQAKGFGATDEGKSTYSARHPPLLKEVKQVIRTALSNYVLAHTDTDATRSDTPETNVSSRAGIRSSSSSLASASQNVVVAQGPAAGGRQSHPATEQIGDASRANKENAVQAVAETAPIEEKPMKFGRMEGFFKTSAAPKKGMKRATEGVAGAGDAQASFGGSVIGTNKRSKPPVHFKFNQGFTNAVRRRVTLSDFL